MLYALENPTGYGLCSLYLKALWSLSPWFLNLAGLQRKAWNWKSCGNC